MVAGVPHLVVLVADPRMIGAMSEMWAPSSKSRSPRRRRWSSRLLSRRIPILVFESLSFVLDGKPSSPWRSAVCTVTASIS